MKHSAIAVLDHILDDVHYHRRSGRQLTKRRIIAGLAKVEFTVCQISPTERTWLTAYIADVAAQHSGFREL